MTGQWTDMFEQPRGGGRATPPSVDPTPLESEGPSIDLVAYKPWVLQRVKSRPAMLLHLRRYEPRSGMWTGWALSYPSLIAAEYTGERMVSLDFGARQFMIEGEGLDQLIGALQEATVTALQEYSAAVWPDRPTGPLIGSIRRLGAATGFDG